MKFPGHSKLITPAPSSLPHAHPALSPEMHAVTSEWISLTVGVPSRRPLALTPPLPPLPEASVYSPEPLALWARPSSSLTLSLPRSGWSAWATPRSAVSPLALPPPHKACSLAPGSQTSLHASGDGGTHVPPPGVLKDSFSQLRLGRSDRVISELSDAFSSQGERQPWREGSGARERKADREAGERCPGGPAISKKSCLRPSDVVRCLSTEQRPTELHTPEESRPRKPRGSPFPGREAEPSELQRGGEPAERKAARTAASEVGLQHARVCPGVLASRVGSPLAAWTPVRAVCFLGNKNMTQVGTEGSSIKVSGLGQWRQRTVCILASQGDSEATPTLGTSWAGAKAHEKEGLPPGPVVLGDDPRSAPTRLRTPGFGVAPCDLVLCATRFVSVTHGALPASA